MQKNILVVDDDRHILSALSMLLKTEGFNPVIASSPDEALAVIQHQIFSLVLMDLNYSFDTTSGEEGLRLINAIREIDEILPIVVMTGWGTIEVAVLAMKNGANDFIQKPWENDRLLSIIKNQVRLADIQIQSQKLIQQNQLLKQEENSIKDIIIESDAIRRVTGILNQVAKTEVSVLLTGENGTGKSMFARYLHELSTVSTGALISVNMGAVTESLFESEMFGHVKGAFTDAKTTRIGRFELADEGTLFLDEIANTPFSQQGKLLRVLEEGQFEKVGSAKTQSVKFRLITATNSDLKTAVELGKFRKDLLYRINTVEVEIPPLRHRVEDIIPLAKAFLAKGAKKYSCPVFSIDSDAELMLKTYSWPGNVRELGHVMERAQILCQSSVIRPHDLGLTPGREIENSDEANREGSHIDLRPIGEIQADIIKERLKYFNGDATKAAKSLGLSRSSFYRRL